jgi:putative FmdB family regulatory protein
MPIYEYLCGSCGHQLEALQKFSDDPLKECPNCHAMALNKQISATSFQLKGTGWYVTDIRDKGKPKPVEKTDSSGTGTTTTSTDTTTTPKDSSNDKAAS